MGIPEDIEREEKRRSVRLAIEAHKKSNKLTISRQIIKRVPRGVSKQFGSGFRPRYTLGYSSPAALGDALRKSVIEQATAKMLHEEAADKCVVLVKDGKLTEEGIKRGIKLP
jgi:hypothetical protein